MTAPTRLGDLSALKLALMAKSVRAEAQPILRADPIAVVGMACRVPGGGDTPDRLWTLLASGVDGVCEVPAGRWDVDRWYDADPAAPGKSLTRSGGFLRQPIDGFDAAYFDILPREAERMDPQQRLFLEVAVEAFDDAGLSRDRLRRSRTGVFVASYHNDYAQQQYGDVDSIDARMLTGTLHSVLANRLSYFLDLRGPSVSIDTACSSSLVATHLACQSLRAGESDIALAAGVSLMVTPELMVSLSKVGFMAPDGRCKTFDKSSDGFGRGEGCGVVILKRLSDAVADRDRILGVVRGSAVNSDGHSTLLAAPNGLAQEAMIAEALANAQLEPSRIGYVETHGTGTALGDPIEVEAIAKVLGRPAEGAGRLLVGAAKANLAHLEAAAGVVGLIKTLLVLRHEAVPAQLHFTSLNPHISLEGTRLSIPTALTPWPAGSRPRCAGVSSFGIGGTNAHVIVEEAPRLPAAKTAEASRILPLSAHDPVALRALAEAWIGLLAETPSSAADLCYTASERRTHHDVRLAVVGRTKEELRARLADRLREGPAAQGHRTTSGAPRIAFVFGGQGPQWFAMGRELLAVEGPFRAAVTAIDALFRPLAGWSILDELAKGEAESRLGETEVAQPALFAVQVGLAALWKSWGIAPASVVGHSIGEVAALHVAGALDLRDAVQVVYHRGRIMQEATGLGRMAQVSLSEAEAEAAVRPFGDKLSVAAVNGPRSAVLSGEAASLESALAALSAKGVAHRMLPVQYAFHSAQMAPFQQRLVSALAGLRCSAPSVAVYSTVTGGPLGGERIDAAYFGRNLREPVRFAAAVTAMAAADHDAFVELGPHPVLGASIAECLEGAGRSAPVVASLRRGRPERETMLEACATLYTVGCAPAWEQLEPTPGNAVTLPPYPWQRKRYWIRPRPEGHARFEAAAANPLLGRPVALAGSRSFVFDGSWSGAPAWLADHRVFGRLVMPGAAVLEALRAAAESALGTGKQLTGFAMHRPLFLPEPGQGRARWQVVVTPQEAGASVELFEAAGADDQKIEWRTVASATAAAASGKPPARSASSGAPLPTDAIYARFADLGVAFGPAFRGLRDVRRQEGAAEGLIDLAAAGEPDAAAYGLHPLLLDGALQLCSLAARAGPEGQLPAEVVLPLGADRVELFQAAPAVVRARVWIREATAAGSLAADALIETEAGAPVAFLEGVRFARAQPDAFAAPASTDGVRYRMAWSRIAAPPRPAGSARAAGRWLILCDRGGVGESLAAELEADGGRCCLVFARTDAAKSGAAVEKTSADRFTIDPARPEHLRAVLAEAGALRGAVHLFGLDLAPLESATSAAAAEEELLGVGSLLHLVQALVSGPGAACPLWVASRGSQAVTGQEPADALRPRSAGVWGLASVAAAEHPELQVRRVDLDPAEEGSSCSGLVEAILSPDPERTSLAIRSGDRFAPRLERDHDKPAAAASDLPLQLVVARPGTLDGLELRPQPRAPLAAGEVRLRVLAAGLNFRDVLLALGMYPGGGLPLGAECAGVVSELGAGVRDFRVGDRVFGFAPASLGAEATVPAAFLAKIPAGLSAEDAAGLPVAFLTAHYGFSRLAKLRKGDRVLINAAAGGVGLAAVQLAQRAGAEVFATAGSPAKRDLLASLGVRRVMDSRSLAFADEIRAATGGQGVDVVLNSLAGDFIGASLGALGKGGRFLELGKRGILTAEEAARLRPDVRYFAFDLGAEALADRGLLRPMLDELVAALGNHELRPLPVAVYPMDQAADAFRFMAQARHVGKLVLRPAPSGALFTADATYWVTGGLGGLGLETARWLCRSGARNLVLSGRQPPSAEAKSAIAALEREGATVRVFAADVADRAASQAILSAIASHLPPLRGVFHAAGAVDDGPLVRQTWPRFAGVLRGKAAGAWVLHELTRGLALDHFVLYSAAGLFLGAPGQGAYPAANAELDALAHARRRMGLPALSVAWGAWASVGMAAKLSASGNDVWSARGLGTISPAVGFDALERLLRDRATWAAVLPIDWRRFLPQLPAGADRGLFAGLARDGAPAATASKPSDGAGALVAKLRSLPPLQRRPALVGHLVERALHVIGLDAATAVDAKVPLKEMGLDSLMAVELRNALARSLGKPLSATLVFDYPTIEALSAHLARLLLLDGDPVVETAAPAPVESIARSEVAALTDLEAERQLLAELEGGTP